MPDQRPAALVTGASGFVGSHLVDALVAVRWRVRCLIRRTSDLRWVPTERVELAYAGLEEPGALASALTGVDVVFHIAGVTSTLAREGYTRVNVEGTRRLLEAMSERAPGALLVLCSSLAAAGPARQGRPLTESDPPSPIGPYGESKLAAERLVMASGLRHVIVRPAAVYGPRDRDVLHAFRLAARGWAPRVGPRDQRLSMVHVRDLAGGFLAAAERGAGRGVYYISNGAIYTWEEITGAIAAAVGRRVRAVPVPLPLARAASLGSHLLARCTGCKPLLTPDRVRDLAQPDWSCEATRARVELGYEPSVPLPAGVRETAAWYRAHGWL
jgi:nucleoside-diphosphate-sugar epimerase